MTMDFGGLTGEDFFNPGAQYPPYKTVGGVIYKHAGGGVYENSVGQRGYIVKSTGGTTINPLTNEVVTETAGAEKFSPLPSDLQPWNAAGAGGGYAPAHADSRYWDLQYRQLDQDQQQFVDDLAFRYANAGMDRDAARQNALAQLIQSRQQSSVSLANASGNIAAQAAEFAANPRNAVAEQMFSNAAFGNAGTPFGSAFTDPNFPQYQTTLQDSFQKYFGGVSGDLAKAREFVSAAIPEEYYPQNAQAPQTAMPDPNQMNPEEQYRFRQWTSPDFRQANPGAYKPPGFAMGGNVSFDPAKPGYTPATSEGGTNLNIFEPSVIMGIDSGHVYATLAEPRPDGKRRGEQIKISPLASEKAKDKKLQEKGKSPVAEMFPEVNQFAEGGTVGVTDASDLIRNINMGLRAAGGYQGGVGGAEPGTPLPNLRLLAGAPWEALQDNPDFLDRAFSGYSAYGISPRQVAATVRKFTPEAPINNLPRVSYA